jgi:hypothetical protein
MRASSTRFMFGLARTQYNAASRAVCPTGKVLDRQRISACGGAGAIIILKSADLSAI